MTQLALKSTEITAFIEDWLKHNSDKQVRWFLGKYDISLDEYHYLAHCAMPAMSYRTTAKTLNYRLQKFIRVVRQEIDELRQNTVKGDEKINRSLENLENALYDASKPYSDDYMEEVMRSLRYGD